MSECNFCKLQRWRRQAKEKGTKITLLNDATWGMGGINVYEHPKEINISKLPGGEDGEREKYRIAWFMGLGDRCEC